MNINDLQRDALISLGYSGALPDMESSFYKENGAATEQDWLQGRTGTVAALPGVKHMYLSSLGYSGTLNDMLTKSLLNGDYYGQVWTPATLFASGEQGAWYDPSDFSTLFQDTAGTVPVTAVGQSVARINDKSGRGNHATQATTAARPLLEQDAGGRYYLKGDGVDDFMSTSGAITFSNGGLFVAGSHTSTTTAGYAALRATGQTVLWAYGGSRGTLWVGSGSSVSVSPSATSAQPTPKIYSICQRQNSRFSEENKVRTTSVNVLQSAAHSDAFTLFAGASNGAFKSAANIYGVILVASREVADAEVTLAADWLNGKTGAF
jgi:hypothetical protein